MKYTPHDYQTRATNFILEHPKAGMLLEMGLGKTVITMTAIDILINEMFEVDRVLVIAPKRVAEDTWTREHAKWDHLRHLRVSKVLGPPEQRRRALVTDADIYVIGRDNVVWLVDLYQKLKTGWPFDMIVIDELSSFKNPQAKRFRALRKVMPKVSRVVGLTGTPSANGLMDLWAEISCWTVANAWARRWAPTARNTSGREPGTVTSSSSGSPFGEPGRRSRPPSATSASA